MTLPPHRRPDSAIGTHHSGPSLPNNVNHEQLSHGPRDDFYPYSQFPESGYPDPESWSHQRRDSIASMPSGPVHRPDAFYDHAGPMGPHAQAFSNPYASDVTLGGLYPSSQGPSLSQNSMQGQVKNGFHGPGSAYAEDNFPPRQPSAASDYIFDSMHRQPPHDDLGGAYEAVAQGHQDVPNEMLYPHFQTSSDHNLASDDVIEQHV